jgi:hypothetical protein
MQGCWEWGRAPRVAGVMLLSVASALGFAEERVGAGEKIERLRIGSAYAALAVRQAVKGASRRLAQPECQKLLQEFTDAAGRPLLATLEERGFGAEAYIEQMRFYDGTINPRCEKPDIYALTLAPGSWLVYVCPRQFRTVYERNPNLAEAYLIHEMLHSLGLGENPPTPQEITDRVVAQCRA